MLVIHPLLGGTPENFFDIFYLQCLIRYLKRIKGQISRIQSKIQFQTEKRAWLGATTMMQYDHVTKILEFPYKNYGKLPAQNIREYHGFVMGDSFSRKDIPKTRKEINHTATVFPDQEANYAIGGLPVKVTSMIENKDVGNYFGLWCVNLLWIFLFQSLDF